MIIKMVAGEDLKMADYLTLGDDGKLDKWSGRDNQIVLTLARHDAKAGETVEIGLPSYPITEE